MKPPRYWVIVYDAAGTTLERARPRGPREAGARPLPASYGSAARRRAISLLAMTALLPGSAQLATGNRRVGLIALRILLGIAVFAALMFLLARINLSFAISFLSNGLVLRVLQVFLVGCALGWVALFVDAWRLSRPPTLTLKARRWFALATAVLMVLLPGSLAYAASGVGASRSAMSQIFTGTKVADSSDGRLNVLLLGGDSGASRTGTRPDSIQLASIDVRTGKPVLFGFARDTENITFRRGSTMARLMPEGWNCGDECLLNGLYTWAQDHKDQFPKGTQDPGVLATEEAVEALTGLDVHYYVLVDLAGFAGMVNALGGLDINVLGRTPIGGGNSPISGYIEPGAQHLDGYHALWYARSREGSSNYNRMARQRCVMTAMANQLDPATVVRRFPEIASASKGILKTDIPSSELGTLTELALKAKGQPIAGVNFVPPLIKPWDYDPQVVKSTVAKTIKESRKAEKSAPGIAATATSSAAPTKATKASAAAETTAEKAGTAKPSLDENADTADLSAVCSAA